MSLIENKDQGQNQSKMLAKLTAQRRRLMSRGLEDLRQWLENLVRIGLGELERSPEAIIGPLPARLVDAQLKGLSDVLKTWPDWILHDSDWIPKITQSIAYLHLLIAAGGKIDSLSTGMQEEVLSRLGVNTRTADIKLNSATTLELFVLAKDVDVYDNLIQIKIWFGQSASPHPILFLAFQHPRSKPQPELNNVLRLSIGDHIKAQAYPYPGIQNPRHVLEDISMLKATSLANTGAIRLKDLNTYWVEKLQANPFLTDSMFVVTADAIHNDGQGKYNLVDGDSAVSVALTQDALITLSSLTAHPPIHLLVSYDGHRLDITSFWNNYEYYQLSLI